MLTVGPRINVIQRLSKRHAQKMQHNLTYMLYGDDKVQDEGEEDASGKSA